MKTLLLILLMSVNAYAQNVSRDSILTPEQAIGYMGTEFKKSHKEFKTGAILSILGGCLSVSAIGIDDDIILGADGKPTGETEIPSMKQGIMITGGVLAFVGLILVIDSHKHIGRAGRIQVKGDKLVLSFK